MFKRVREGYYEVEISAGLSLGSNPAPLDKSCLYGSEIRVCVQVSNLFLYHGVGRLHSLDKSCLLVPLVLVRKLINCCVKLAETHMCACTMSVNSAFWTGRL